MCSMCLLPLQVSPLLPTHPVAGVPGKAASREHHKVWILTSIWTPSCLLCNKQLEIESLVLEFFNLTGDEDLYRPPW